MRHGSLLLCGDAAHIVPPTGAKGLNLAASDVHYAAEALTAYFRRADKDAVIGYSAKALARVWKSERFSWTLTKLMHRFPMTGRSNGRCRWPNWTISAPARRRRPVLPKITSGCRSDDAGVMPEWAGEETFRPYNFQLKLRLA
jgi:hypothetical protein